ncbi:myosin head, motor domain-containing protein, partial [Blastocladiella britannica]
SDGADPHIYGVANETYFALRRTGVDQAIVLSGEAGAGKTTHARLLVSHLARIAAASPPSKRDEKLAVRIAALNVVLSTLGSASLPHSPDASRLGTYAELQYTARGKLAGVKTIVYALDRERVTRQRLGERNFHAFYALVHGAPADIKSAL